MFLIAEQVDWLCVCQGEDGDAAVPSMTTEERDALLPA